MATVDTDYLAQFGYTREQVVAENDVKFDSLEDLYDIHTEHNLGDIIADAYAYAVIIMALPWMWRSRRVEQSVIPIQKETLRWRMCLIRFHLESVRTVCRGIR